MSSILFLLVIQAFLETLQIEAQPIQFSYFPENKNGNLKTCKGRLLSQNLSAKGLPFEFWNSFFVDDSFFLFQNHQELQNAIEQLNRHFARFGLIMHIGNGNTKSKSECMFFPASLMEANKQTKEKKNLEDITLSDGKMIHFVQHFKYLGSTITPLLNEDTKIEERIKKAKSIMGASRHFFNNKDINRRIKKEIYIAGPLNALLWGCESWNLMKKNLDKLKSFHHRVIRRILNIKWNQVREDHIKIKRLENSSSISPTLTMHILTGEQQHT
jgi:hypothetical protein